MLPWKPILMLGILSPFVSLEGLNAGNNDAKTVYLNCTASVSILIPTYFDDTYVETASIYKQILFFAYIFLGVFFRFECANSSTQSSFRYIGSSARQYC